MTSLNAAAAPAIGQKPSARPITCQLTEEEHLPAGPSVLLPHQQEGRRRRRRRGEGWRGASGLESASQDEPADQDEREAVRRKDGSGQEAEDADSPVQVRTRPRLQQLHSVAPVLRPAAPPAAAGLHGPAAKHGNTGDHGRTGWWPRPSSGQLRPHYVSSCGGSFCPSVAGSAPTGVSSAPLLLAPPPLLLAPPPLRSALPLLWFYPPLWSAPPHCYLCPHCC